MKVKLLKHIRKKYSVFKVSQINSNEFPETSLNVPYYILRKRNYLGLNIDLHYSPSQILCLRKLMSIVRRDYKQSKRVETKVWYK